MSDQYGIIFVVDSPTRNTKWTFKKKKKRSAKNSLQNERFDTILQSSTDGRVQEKKDRNV